jgi:hypothetical protein
VQRKEEVLSVKRISVNTGMTTVDMKTTIKDNKLLRTVDGELAWTLTTEQGNDWKNENKTTNAQFEFQLRTMGTSSSTR